MPILSSPRWLLVCAALLSAPAAYAQGYPPAAGGPPPAANPMCQRLESQLAMIDRGGADPAKAEQIRRYEEAQNRQQAELDRVTTQAKRMGCDSTGLFSLFNGQAAQCGPVNNQIQQMRANLDQITGSLQQLRGGGGGGSERDMQRRSVLLALAQNNCGPQYAAAARAAQPGNFLDNFFGGNNNPDGTLPAPPPEASAPSGTYRTVCARSCDGFYFPISFATVPGRFADDERTCKSLCPATDATLFTYRNPGEDMNQAVSINGQPYSSSPNAFRYRREFDATCSCKAAGQTWADALKNIDDKASAEQQGDIIVTEDRAKKMSQPLAPAKSTQGQKKGAPTAPAAPASPPTPAASASPAPPATDAGGSKPIRSVGPTFIPAR
ncbi:DUF2865 domain-containing protein [Bradyrhizobium sp. 2TAF24]|uniref:DUF2865 domain-containing protein n=1 Tax=Bradyrhizobium sp. 2TAF24 TaxID=3233011 RepID=UPI003F8DDA88